LNERRASRSDRSLVLEDIAMKHIGTAIMFGLAVAAASVAACSSSRNSPAPGGQGGTSVNTDDGTGSVGFQYTIPGGEHISTINYTLTNGTNTYTGTVNVGASSVISFVIGGVAAGSGYSVTVSGKSDDGLVSCSGSFGTGVSDAGQNNGAPFSVADRATTTVNVQLICIDVPNQNQGSVVVNGQASCCATWDTIVANPTTATTTAPGNTSALSANASGPCDGDAGFGVNLNCTWSVLTGTGTVSATTTDNKGNFFASFTCPATGETDTIQLFCTDGPLPDGGFCPANLTTGTTTVVCGSTPCQNPTVGTGVEANPNTATGSCPAPSVNTGTLKDSSGNFCCSAGPCQGVGTGVEATPNTATGSCPAGQGNTGTLKDGAGNFCCSTLAPCTTGTAGCVQCQGNNTGAGANLCSPTEVQFVQHDIATGKATAPGPDPAGSCYTCLLGGGCIDDTQFTDTGHECEDTLATFGTAAECESVISCILGSSCAASAVSTCYCGTAGVSTACQGNPAPGPINGSCDTQIATGLGFPVTDGTDNTKNLTDVTRAAGKADQIFQCAQSNACAACLH
jgi:hypothetical protein